MPIARGRGRQIADRQLAANKKSVTAYDSSNNDNSGFKGDLSITLGEAVTQGFAGYVGSDGLGYKADSSSETTTADFIYIESGSASSVVQAVQIGTAYYYPASLTPFTVGGLVYLSTSGTLTQTEPSSGIWQCLGVAISIDTFIVQIDEPLEV